MRRLLIPCIIFLNVLHAGFYDRGLEGRYYYQERKEETEEKEEITKENALSQLRIFQEKFQAAKALAVMDPTYENITIYLRIQKQVVENSEKFAKIWEVILLEDAQLSDQLLNPTASFAVAARKNLAYQRIDQFIEKNKKDHLLLFVFDSTDPLSLIAAEMAKEFEEETTWKVIGVSLDGGSIPQFPSPRYSTDKGEALGVMVAPAFIVACPEKEYSEKVGFGAISISQLKENIYKQLSKRVIK
ncbi:MAG: hypothetical protein K1060chlam2_00587 [Chlamydiae bacterium]|nr:hypothetical protein [Chlamydiota bacterium]